MEATITVIAKTTSAMIVLVDIALPDDNEFGLGTVKCINAFNITSTNSFAQIHYFGKRFQMILIHLIM